ncbi:MAG TPA: family 16 glycoside hydrolase [Vicinamibacteria bacterium]|nr:family 16 glycoside hydrolase [Vicinamibacteria bacterium]
MRRLVVTLPLAFLAVGTAFGGDVAPPRPAAAVITPEVHQQVSSILEGLPAPNAAARDKACSALLALGAPALADVISRVQPPGAGDDASARFAVNGLAVYVTRPGAESERLLIAQALLSALDRGRDKEVAAFLISQVQLAGREESVRALGNFLLDERLAGPALAALVTIGGPEVPTVLLRALETAPAAVRPALVKALGERPGRTGVRRLAALAASSDEPTRQAALLALATTGDPSAGGVLSRTRVAVSYRERTQAPALYLLWARRLAETGHAGEAATAAHAVLENYRRPGEAQHAAEALALLVSVEGEKALPDLLSAVDGPDRGLRGAALALAPKIPAASATGRWVEKAGSSPPFTSAAILDMLGRRGDAVALPFVRESLHSGEDVVRVAAIGAAVRVGRDAVLPDLLSLVAAATPADAQALQTALLGYTGAQVTPPLLRLLDGLPLPGKAIAIDVLGEKGAREAVEPLFSLARGSDPALRQPALVALGQVAVPADVPRLLALLGEATGDDAARARDAIAAAALREPDAELRADGVLAVLQQAPPLAKARLVEVLPRVGGSKALRTAVRETTSPDADVRSAAITALARWPDDSAADELLRVASSASSPEQARAAFLGYVRLLARSERPAWQKAAGFEKALSHPAAGDARKAMLGALGSVREPEAMRLLGRYLDDVTLRDAAGSALLNLASLQSAEEPWLSGHEAVSLLRRVEATLGDTPAKERADRLIAARLKQGGFVSLFDGRTLDGWKGLVGDPPSRAKMTKDELARAQSDADARMREHWKVEGGVLRFDGKGENLCTRSDYGDFEMLVDWKIDKDGDSGIYLRGFPQVQIWDATANPVGSGGLYNNKKGPSQPTEKADRPVGEWNTFRIVMIGERVTVYLNDKRVVDNAVLENYWDAAQPIEPAGQIELQAHGNPLAFRNLYLREIPRDTAATAPTLGGVEAAEGFVALFNGRDLAGWTGNLDGYTAEGGAIVVHPERAGGNLYTAKEYTNFVLRFDFKLTPAANNGIGVRAPLEGDAAYVGMELQVLEDGSPVYWGLQPYQYHGSIYGVVPARRGVLRPTGEWNSEEVTVRGRRVSVVVNGATVVDADIDAASAGGTMDHREHPGLQRTSGHLGFLGHGSIVAFRNLRVKELK